MCVVTKLGAEARRGHVDMPPAFLATFLVENCHGVGLGEEWRRPVRVEVISAFLSEHGVVDKVNSKKWRVRVRLSSGRSCVAIRSVSITRKHSTTTDGHGEIIIGHRLIRDSPSGGRENSCDLLLDLQHLDVREYRCFNT